LSANQTSGDLVLGGMVPFSTVDFPGHLAAVLFTAGCPLRCRYCHNPHLRRRQGASGRDWPQCLAWLERRVGLLDAVVFSGGEPTAQAGLAAALSATRDLGFTTALHSAGILPERFAAVLGLVDWVGFDVKAPFMRYAAVTGVAGSGERARRSLEVLLASDCDYELRTTVHGDLLGAEDLVEMAGTLANCGARRWVLQSFRPAGCADEGLRKAPATAWVTALLPELRAILPGTELR